MLSATNCRFCTRLFHTATNQEFCSEECYDRHQQFFPPVLPTPDDPDVILIIPAPSPELTAEMDAAFGGLDSEDCDYGGYGEDYLTDEDEYPF